MFDGPAYAIINDNARLKACRKGIFSIYLATGQSVESTSNAVWI